MSFEHCRHSHKHHTLHHTCIHCRSTVFIVNRGRLAASNFTDGSCSGATNSSLTPLLLLFLITPYYTLVSQMLIKHVIV